MSFDSPGSAPGDASADEPRLRADARTGADIDPDGIDRDDDGVLYEDQVQPEYGILGFTLREIIIIGAWLIGFVASFFPIGPIGDTVWTSGIHWILMMGVPTVAVFLVVLRRFSPDGIRRVGSLGIDQFASVAAAVAAVSWAQVLWQQVAATIETGVLLIGWVAVVGQLATLVLVAATVFAPLLPRLREDFHGRLETLAHRNANPVRPVIARPRAEREAVPSPLPPAGAVRPDDADGPAAAPPAAAEPRVETALTMVIPHTASDPDALDRASASDHLSATDAGDADSTPTAAAPIAQSAQPAPVQPAPVQPAAVEPVFVEPAFVEPAPVESPPLDLKPVESQPLELEPDEPASVESQPLDLQPVEPAPVESQPDEPAPVEPAPVEPAPVEPEATSTSEPAAPAPQPVVSDHRDDDTEVLYNTAAVEALQSIFADDTPDSNRTVEHNTAPDGVAGPATSAVDDADERPLRRTRGEQSAEPDHLGQPEPFWILAPTERDVLDERGHPLFRIGPTAWALAIEDRGGAFVVRHEDGRIGYLHDIFDITKG